VKVKERRTREHELSLVISI